MLNIWLKPNARIDSIKAEIIRDAEAYFHFIDHTWDEKDKMMVRDIESAELHKDYFIDRFGYKIPIDNLSTGSKVALIVNHCPDRIVDIVECGFNARDAIIYTLNSGNIYTRYLGYAIRKPNWASVMDDVPIDVMLNGECRVRSIDELNYVLKEDYIGPGFPINNTYNEDDTNV